MHPLRTVFLQPERQHHRRSAGLFRLPPAGGGACKICGSQRFRRRRTHPTHTPDLDLRRPASGAFLDIRTGVRQGKDCRPASLDLCFCHAGADLFALCRVLADDRYHRAWNLLRQYLHSRLLRFSGTAEKAPEKLYRKTPAPDGRFRGCQVGSARFAGACRPDQHFLQ